MNTIYYKENAAGNIKYISVQNYMYINIHIYVRVYIYIHSVLYIYIKQLHVVRVLIWVT